MMGLWRRILEVVRRRQLDREGEEELAHHVEMLLARKVEAGIGEREARRQVRIEVGSVQSAREQIAEGRTGFALEQLARESIYAARVLRRSAGVTLLSVTTMGVGIGVSAILFALVNGVVLRPLPYPEPERLVRIFDTNLEAGIDRAGAASGNIGDWRRRASAFHGIAGFYALGRTFSTDTDAEVLIAAQVSEDFFSIMRVPPLLGRTFSEEETRRAQFNTAAQPIGTDPVVILSHGLWRRLGGDREIVGRTMTLDRRLFQVVGVVGDMRFRGPRSEPRPEIYIPHAQRSYLIMNVVLRSAGDPRALIPTVRAVLKDIDPLKPAHGLYLLEDLIGATYARDRQAMVTLLVFAATAIFLAVLSIYGVLTQRVRERAREIGIRMAMGADAKKLVGWVARGGCV